MNNTQMYDDAYNSIKQEVMVDFGYEDEDLNIDGNEDEVNRETDARFVEKFGFEYSDVDEYSEDEDEKEIEWLLSNDEWEDDEWEDDF